MAVNAVVSCRFEPTNEYGDEVVLMQLLEVMVNLIRSPAGSYITNKNIWHMVLTSFRLATDSSLSELLRSTAANSLSHMVLTIFSRTKQLLESSKEQFEPSPSKPTPVDSTNYAPLGGEGPYGTPVLVRIVQFLAKLTDPIVNDEVIRVLGLQLVNLMLETGGEALGTVGVDMQPSPIVGVLQGDLCKHLLRNSMTNDLAVLSLTLRVVFNLFHAMKRFLKVQLEVFLTSVHFRIVESSTTSAEQKELALESLLDFCRDPALMLDLYLNYDCDIKCSNLFEKLASCIGSFGSPPNRLQPHLLTSTRSRSLTRSRSAYPTTLLRDLTSTQVRVCPE